MTNSNWSKDQESEFKEIIRRFFNRKISRALKGSGNPLGVGDELAGILENSDEEVVKIITPRAVRKWASTATFPKWQKIISDPRMVSELRIIGRSIANTMRPLAGNNFALWVAKILNVHFRSIKAPLAAITRGEVKRVLNQNLVVKSKIGKGTRDYKPDIDIVLVRKDQNNKPVAIISAKTTLAERVMQTINWFRHIRSIPGKYRRIKMFLVTAWDTFKVGANRERVQELDGVYVCNKDVKEYGNIKLFSKIVKDLKRFYR